MHPPRLTVRRADGPAPDETLGTLLRTRVDEMARGAVEGLPSTWVRALWAVGTWLHDGHHPDAGPSTPAPSSVGTSPRPDSLLPDPATAVEVPAPHRHSLELWAALLAPGSPPGGPVTLDDLELPDQLSVVVHSAAGAARSPALDVGAILGDLHRIAWRAETLGLDARPHHRLAAAVTTSCAGLPPDGTLDVLAVARATALRAYAATPRGSADDAPLVRALVERAWLLAG